jgi:tetratricopeptide (TPR) repeat protein
MRTGWRKLGVAAVVATILAGLAVTASAQLTDPYYKGLEQRGLRTLMEAYLKQKAPAPAAGTTDQSAAGDPASERALALLAVQKAGAAQTIGERDTAFKEARDHYTKAIAALVAKLGALGVDKVMDRNSVRYDIITVRLELANTIFQKWLKTDLDMMEMTDRRFGDRQRVTDILKAGADQYAAALQDVATWESTLDQLPQDDRLKVINSGKRRLVNNITREAQYNNAWIIFYYGWLLPKDYKAPQGQPKRDEILNDAITKFMQYTAMPDRVSAKWYAYMVVGIAYRELGKTKEALESLAMANSQNVPEAVAEGLKIRVAYERGLTLLRADQPDKAREAVAEARSLWGDKLQANLHGLAMPLLEAETYIAEARKTNNEAAREKGISILKEMYKRPNPWPAIIQDLMKSMVGAVDTAALGDQPLFMIWTEANEAMQKAQDEKDAKSLEKAEKLYAAYAEKGGPKDPKYPDALYFQAAAKLQLGQKAAAAALFKKVADEFPTFQFGPPAAQYAVSIAGQVYETAQVEENRLAYEDVLRWFVAKWLKADPDQQYYLGLVLYRGKKFIEARDAFGQVAEEAEHFADSKFWVPLCGLEHFRDKILPTRDKQLILSGARDVAKGLLGYADFAFAAQATPLADAKKTQLMDWAQAAYVNAADVYLYPEVELPADALPVLDTLEQKFELTDEAHGRVLKLRIDGLTKLGRLDEAGEVLQKFLAIAKQEEVGPVLRGLSRAMIDDVRELIRRGQKDQAAAKVEQARKLGNMLVDWLTKSAVDDKQVQIENTRYDLAELYLAVGNYSGALAIYEEIAGKAPHKDPKPGEPLKEDAIYGMARAHEGLADAAADEGLRKTHFEVALDMWRVLTQVQGLTAEANWERLYHLYYCKHKLGDKDEVAKALKALEIMKQPEPLGGKDPVLQKKYRDLLTEVGG